MQFERVATRHNPQTAAEVFAIAREIREKKAREYANWVKAAPSRARVVLPSGVRVELLTRANGQTLLEPPLDCADTEPGFREIYEAPIGPVYLRKDIKSIIHAVCDFYSVSKNDLLSPRRFKGHAHARQVAMFLCKQITERSYPEIGRRFGGRDHTTVLHGVRKIEALVQENSALAAEVAFIRSRFVTGAVE